MSLEVKKAVIPVAGLGTRFLPATKAIPKEMLPVVDKPTIQYVVEEAIAAGIDDVVLVTGRGKVEIENHFDIAYELEDVLSRRGDEESLQALRTIDQMIRVVGVRQKEPLGLGHAISMAEGLVSEEAFTVLLGDDLIQSEVPGIRQLLNAWEVHGKAVVAVERVPRSDVHRYGVVGQGETLSEGLTLVRDVVEKPSVAEAPSDLAIIGRYVLPTRIFGLLKDLKPGSGGEIQLTDALRTLAKEEGIVACEIQGTRYDTGHRLGWMEANLAYGLSHPDLGEEIKAMVNRVLGAVG